MTAFLDLDLVKALKQEAERSHSKYQTLMNQKLRDSLFGKQVDDHLLAEIRSIVKQELAKKAG